MRFQILRTYRRGRRPSDGFRHRFQTRRFTALIKFNVVLPPSRHKTDDLQSHLRPADRPRWQRDLSRMLGLG
jgi:hypothetical protein